MISYPRKDLESLLDAACRVGLIDTFAIDGKKITLRRGEWERTLGPQQTRWFLHGMLRAYVFSQHLEEEGAGTKGQAPTGG